ncbi:hypothetical protein tb265_26090 [Gemmatimonadetes bacterium T265]|nr:hypothetical protein tb265_26090 [Gemmatimonadetes bacterium T265]
MIFGAKRVKPRAYRSPDGLTWTVTARAPGASTVMVVFLHPDRSTTERDRYGWWVSAGPEARDVTARLGAAEVLASLSDTNLADLFRRSMPIANNVPRFESA